MNSTQNIFSKNIHHGHGTYLQNTIVTDIQFCKNCWDYKGVTMPNASLYMPTILAHSGHFVLSPNFLLNTATASRTQALTILTSQPFTSSFLSVAEQATQSAVQSA